MVKAKLWAVIRREFLERAQNRWFIAGSLLGPVFIAGLFFLPAYLSLRNARPDSSSLIVIDATGAGVGDRLRMLLTETPPGSASSSTASPPATSSTIDVRVTPPNAVAEAESLATKAVVEKTVDGYVVLDERTLRGERARMLAVERPRPATCAGSRPRCDRAYSHSGSRPRM